MMSRALIKPDELQAAIRATVHAWIGPMDVDMVIGRLRRTGFDSIGKSTTLRRWKLVYVALESLEGQGVVHRIDQHRWGKSGPVS
jgi:hypothetical protein